MASQALNSLGNFLALLFAVHSLSPNEFGRYALIVGVYVFALSMQQSVVGDVLVVHLPHPLSTRMMSGAISAAYTIGLGASLILVLISLFFASARTEALVLAVCIPFLLAQDAYRYINIANGESPTAAIMDGAWLAVWIAGAALLVRLGAERSPAFLMAVWALGGTLEGMLAITFGRPSVRALRSYLRDGRFAIRFFVVGQGVSNFTTQATGWVFAAAYGASTVGALRASQALFGPLNVLYSALRTTMGRELRSASLATKIRRSVFTAFALGLLAASVTLVLTNARLLHLLLGDSSVSASAFIPALGVQQIGLAALVAAIMLARATSQYKRVLHFTVGANLVELAFVCVCAWLIRPTDIVWVVGICWLIVGPMAVISIVRNKPPRVSQIQSELHPIDESGALASIPRVPNSSSLYFGHRRVVTVLGDSRLFSRLMCQMDGSTPRRQAFRAAARISAATRIFRLVSQRSSVEESSEIWALSQHLRDVAARQGNQTAALAIMWPSGVRSHRRYVIGVDSNGGNSLFCKVSTKPDVDGDLFEAEQTMLEALHNRRPIGWRTPRSYGLRHEAGSISIVMEGIPGRRTHPSWDDIITGLPLQQDELPKSRSVRSALELPWFRASMEVKASSAFRRAVISATQGPISVGLVNGDIRRSNTVMTGTQPWLFDWEFSDSQGPHQTDVVVAILNRRDATQPGGIHLAAKVREIARHRGVKEGDLVMSLMYLSTFKHKGAQRVMCEWAEPGNFNGSGEE